MIQIETDTSQLRNGNVLKAHSEVMTPNGLIVVPQLFWIRARTKEPIVLNSTIRCEDQGLRTYHFPVIAILEGRHNGLIFEGVFSPRDLNVGDPRRLRSALGKTNNHPLTVGN